MVTAASGRLVAGARLVSAADIGWVLATLTLGAVGAFSAAGTVLMVVMGLVVGALAVAQLRLSRALLVGTAAS